MCVYTYMYPLFSLFVWRRDHAAEGLICSDTGKAPNISDGPSPRGRCSRVITSNLRYVFWNKMTSNDFFRLTCDRQRFPLRAWSAGGTRARGPPTTPPAAPGRRSRRFGGGQRNSSTWPRFLKVGARGPLTPPSPPERLWPTKTSCTNTARPPRLLGSPQRLFSAPGLSRRQRQRREFGHEPRHTAGGPADQRQRGGRSNVRPST